MERVGAMLRDIPKITGIYTSPLLRARESADVISEAIMLNPWVEPSLTDFETLERWTDMQDRMREFAERISCGGITVAVTHNYPITSIVGHFLKMDERTAHAMEVAPCSFTVIDFEKPGNEAILAIGNSTITQSKLVG